MTRTGNSAKYEVRVRVSVYWAFLCIGHVVGVPSWVLRNSAKCVVGVRYCEALRSNLENSMGEQGK
ncbi:MAG: hypothetical protein ACK5L5_08165 [Bacteroidales bacterium]